MSVSSLSVEPQFKAELCYLKGFVSKSTVVDTLPNDEISQDDIDALTSCSFYTDCFNALFPYYLESNNSGSFIPILEYLVEKGALQTRREMFQVVEEMLADREVFYESLHQNLLQSILKYHIEKSVSVDVILSEIQKLPGFVSSRDGAPLDRGDALLTWLGLCAQEAGYDTTCCNSLSHLFAKVNVLSILEMKYAVDLDCFRMVFPTALDHDLVSCHLCSAIFNKIFSCQQMESYPYQDVIELVEDQLVPDEDPAGEQVKYESVDAVQINDQDENNNQQDKNDSAQEEDGPYSMELIEIDNSSEVHLTDEQITSPMEHADYEYTDELFDLYHFDDNSVEDCVEPVATNPCMDLIISSQISESQEWHPEDDADKTFIPLEFIIAPSSPQVERKKEAVLRRLKSHLSIPHSAKPSPPATKQTTVTFRRQESFKPCGNVQIIKNALRSLLKGPLQATLLREALDIATEQEKQDKTSHLIVLLRGTQVQTYRALYLLKQESTQHLEKIHGMGPESISNDQIKETFKYSTPTKVFHRLPTTSISLAVHAINVK